MGTVGEGSSVGPAGAGVVVTWNACGSGGAVYTDRFATGAGVVTAIDAGTDDPDGVLVGSDGEIGSDSIRWSRASSSSSCCRVRSFGLVWVVAMRILPRPASCLLTCDASCRAAGV